MANGTTVTPSHGTKRRAEDNLDNEQRLSKRFDSLNLEHNGKLWIPIPASNQTPRPVENVPRQEPVEHMQVESTKDRVYIHNLDEELAELASETPKLYFLPDIEKEFSRIPLEVLRSEQSDQKNGTELILYTAAPSSLSVPEEHDSVRKAILEVRARAREKTTSNTTVVAASREALLHDEMLMNQVVPEGAKQDDVDMMDTGD